MTNMTHGFSKQEQVQTKKSNFQPTEEELFDLGLACDRYAFLEGVLVQEREVSEVRLARPLDKRERERCDQSVMGTFVLSDSDSQKEANTKSVCNECVLQDSLQDVREKGGVGSQGGQSAGENCALL